MAFQSGAEKGGAGALAPAQHDASAEKQLHLVHRSRIKVHRTSNIEFVTSKLRTPQQMQ